MEIMLQQIFFLWTLWCIGLAEGRPGVGSRAASRDVGPYKVPSGPKSFCSPCDVRVCPQITPEMCPGKLVKDDCGCCPQCDLSQKAPGLVSTTNQTCDNVECAGSHVCMLNIQGIPICRCPSIFMCRRRARKDICGRDGKSYKSKCYLKVAECTLNKKIRVAHKGVCVTKSPVEKKGRKKNRDTIGRRNRNRRRKQKGKGQGRLQGKRERGQQRRPKRDHNNNNNRPNNNNNRQGRLRSKQRQHLLTHI